MVVHGVTVVSRVAVFELIARGGWLTPVPVTIATLYVTVAVGAKALTGQAVVVSFKVVLVFEPVE
jgi:hypothetical protein